MEIRCQCGEQLSFGKDRDTACLMFCAVAWPQSVVVRVGLMNMRFVVLGL